MWWENEQEKKISWEMKERESEREEGRSACGG